MNAYMLTLKFLRPHPKPSGKSALIEALMGFQFNSVGGGTKTRRPIAIHMKYNASCASPSCFLLAEDGVGEKAMVLQELQVWWVVKPGRG